MEKKDRLSRSVLGTNLSFAYRRLKLGCTFTASFLGDSIHPEVQPYLRYSFEGDRLCNAGIDYTYLWGRILFFGETAFDESEGFASLNGILLSPLSRLSLLCLSRLYLKSYHSFFANSFAEGSYINNEHGLYLGVEVRPVKYWKLSAYVDSFVFPWLKYGIDAPSSGYDVLFRVDYSPKRYANMYLKCKYKRKEKSMNVYEKTMSLLANTSKFSVRYQLSYHLTKSLELRHLIEMNRCHSFVENPTAGLLFAQDFRFKCRHFPLGIDLCYAFFDTEQYDNRIYVYEKDVLYAFSIPMYEGQGNRMYVNASYHLSASLSFWLKLAYTKYIDRDEIGSLGETISGCHKTDVRAMIRYRF